MKLLFLATIAFTTSLSSLAQTPHAPMGQRLTLATNAFEDGGIIPDRYTMAAPDAKTKGAISPKLSWSFVPDSTQSFTLILTDPDTAMHHTNEQFLHWILFNIPGTARGLPEGVPATATLSDGSIQIRNSTHSVGYFGMAAGAAGPYHHYTFELYALDARLSLGPDATQADVEKAMDGHILMKSVVVGRFHLPKQ